MPVETSLQQQEESIQGEIGASVDGRDLQFLNENKGWYREEKHGREVEVSQIAVQPAQTEGKYRMTAVIDGQAISHEITQRDYDKFLAVDDYHRMKLFSKIFSEVDMKTRPEAQRGLGTKIFAALTAGTVVAAGVAHGIHHHCHAPEFYGECFGGPPRLNKDLQKKAIKEARKQAKELTKEGFKTPVGKLPLDKQLENSWEKQMEIDMNGNPYWYIATSRVIGGNQSAAAMQATNTAKIDIAGQVQTKVTQLIESKVANDDMGQEEAASLSSAVAAGKSIISGTLGRTIPLVEVYRTLPNKNVEVMVTIGYSLEAANKVAVKALSEELAKKSPELAKELDKLAQ